MRILFCLFMVLLISHTSMAGVDKFNTYQWNQASKNPWFEWWYYKIVLPENKESFYFVYGVVNPWDKAQALSGSRSYVGMGDFNDNIQVENKFNTEEFHASRNETYVAIKGLIATDRYILGEITDEKGENYSWDISIEKEWSFNAMSWAINKNITNIKWYPAQASAKCTGKIKSREKIYQFKNAPCYQDRNWGHSFPLWWTWIVSNRFKNSPDTVLVVGGGRPKYFDTKFPLQGVSIGLKHKGVTYDFIPNNFDFVKVDINFGKWEVTAYNGLNKLEISAFAPKNKFMDIPFVTPNGEVFHDYETLTGEVTVKLYKLHSLRWKLIDTLYSDEAGIEYGEPNKANFAPDFFSSKIHLQ